jgi:hypothetical protein
MAMMLSENLMSKSAGIADAIVGRVRSRVLPVRNLANLDQLVATGKVVGVMSEVDGDRLLSIYGCVDLRTLWTIQ